MPFDFIVFKGKNLKKCTYQSAFRTWWHPNSTSRRLARTRSAGTPPGRCSRACPRCCTPAVCGSSSSSPPAACCPLDWKLETYSLFISVDWSRFPRTGRQDYLWYLTIFFVSHIICINNIMMWSAHPDELDLVLKLTSFQNITLKHKLIKFQNINTLRTRKRY